MSAMESERWLRRLALRGGLTFAAFDALDEEGRAVRRATSLARCEAASA